MYRSKKLVDAQYFLRARYYNPQTGRFISRDPVRGTLTNPLTQNPYIYAGDNPITYSDPSGRWFTEFLSGQQSWSDFQLELGQASEQLAQDSAAFNFATNHPYISGPAIGVASGLAAYGACAAGAVLLTGLAANSPNFILNSDWKDWSTYLENKGWTLDEIQQTIANGQSSVYEGANWLNPGNPMSIITNIDAGKSLIIDNITNEIIQLGMPGYKF